MTHDIGSDAHQDLVRFLQEQSELGRTPEPILFDPVIQIKPEKIFIGRGSRIDSFVKLEGGEGLRIGEFVHVASFAHLGIGGGTLVIEDFAAVASGAKIITGSNQIDAISMSACAPKHLQRAKRSITVMHRYSVVLTNGVILPGVTLHEGAVLAAGGVATKDIPAWEIWGGVPARLMAKRLTRKETVPGYPSVFDALEDHGVK